MPPLTAPLRQCPPCCRVGCRGAGLLRDDRDTLRRRLLLRPVARALVHDKMITALVETVIEVQLVEVGPRDVFAGDRIALPRLARPEFPDCVQADEQCRHSTYSYAGCSLGHCSGIPTPAQFAAE
jgi:hypothetical protein